MPDVLDRDERRESLNRILVMAHALSEAKYSAILAGLTTDELMDVCRPIVDTMLGLCEAVIDTRVDAETPVN